MGGKKKQQAQRTKNNARPSSSARSAELLGSSFTSCLKESGLIFPSISTFSLLTDELDSSLDSNFELVLKKMKKKDSTTKLKALQEFTELCRNSDPEVIKTILPFWPRIYCTLVIDSEHKVREAAHIAHIEVVQKAKRNLAPYLKQLAGAWFTSQYDTYPPAASAATKAFETTFPATKLNDAIAFCQEEILAYIYENIIEQTPQTVTSSKNTTSEDAEAKYQRIIVSSLQGYALYLKKVSVENIEKVSEQNKKIVSHQKFWKIARVKVSSIRSSWFNVISALCQKSPFLLENENAHVVGAVFGNLDEGDPSVLPAVWEAVLSTITTIKEWWKYLNVEKVVLNKLWKILREGGQGNASVIYPNLLPLLSHFPKLADMTAFYSLFFDNLRTGLKFRTAISSRSEAIAVSTAFVECLQFVILQNQNDVALCEKLIKNQLIPSIEWALVEPQATFKSLFNQISTVVQYWSRNVDNRDVQNYSQYLKYFWENLDSLFQKLLVNLELNFEIDAVSEFANRQLELLKSLKQITKSKKKMKVSFSSESQGAETSDSQFSTKGSFSENYLATLDSIILSVCKSYVNFINEKKSKVLVQYLHILLQDFESRKFFEFLNAQVTTGTPNSLLDIYENLLARWLEDDNVSSVYVVDLIFLLLKHANESEKNTILESLLKVSDEEIFSWCVQKSLSFPYKNCPVLQKWLKRPEIGAFLVEISKRIVIDKCAPNLNLILKQTLEENEDGDLYIAEEVLREIIETFTKALSFPFSSPSTLDVCIRFCAHIAGAVYTEKYKLQYGDGLLLTLFELSCLSNFPKDFLTRDTIWEMKNVWQDVVSMLSRELPLEEFVSLFGKFANITERVIFEQSRKDGFELDLVVENIVLLAKSVRGGNPIRIDDALQLILRRSFLEEQERSLTYVCKKAEYVKGRLSCPYEILEEVEVVEDVVNVINYFIWSCLVAKVVTIPLPNGEDDSDDEDNDSDGEGKNEESGEQGGVRIIEYLSGAEEIVSRCVYSIALAKSFLENFGNTKYFEEVEKHYLSIRQKITELLKNGDKNFCRRVEDSLCKKTMQEGWIWASAAHLFYSEINKKSLSLVYVELLRNYRDQIVSEISVLHLGQLFSKSLTFDHAQYDLVPLESVICLRSLIHCDEIDGQVAEVFGKIDEFKANKKFLLDGESYSWEDLQITIEVARLFSAIVQHKVDLLSSSRWDFVVVAFTTWLENVVKMKNKFGKLELEALLAAISDLYVSIQKHLYWLKDHAPTAAKNTLDEWRDLFSAEVHRFNVDIWLHFIDNYQGKTNIPLNDIPFLQEFGKCIQHFDYNYLISKKDANAPKWSKLVKKCCSNLTHPLNTLQLWSYHMLLVLLPGLVEIDWNSVNTNIPQATGLTLEHLKDTLVHTEEIVHSMLLEFRIGEDSCIVQPFTDSYTYTYAYLLLWSIVLKLCSLSSTELRYQYADWIKNHDFLTKLLNNLFRLMPTEVLHHSNAKIKPFANLFTENVNTDFTGNFSSLHIEHMVCWTYYQTLSQLPALVRQWWSMTESRVAQIVDRVTSVYVSPTLCSQELADVIQHEKKFKNMTVKVYPIVREVVAVYTVDEAQMELLIILPANYPLKVPDIQCNRQICGTSHRQWILQLKTNVLHQNGRIWDGLSLWNNNLDKKFDGVEECYICFAVLHQGTYQLPKLSCSTCRKKFHSACLYKWFSTSNKSTCPICRNLF